MDFILICKDKPNSAAVRQKLRGPHLEFIHDKQHLFKFGGPLLDDLGRMQGSLIIISFPDRAALDAYLAKDPYFSGGLFESVTIHATRQIVPELEPGQLAREIDQQKEKAQKAMA
jgi:uncharacterized protein YciI